MEMINLLIMSALILIFPIFWSLFFGISKKESIEKTGRILFFDYLKGLSIISVIIIHTFGFITTSFKYTETGVDLINNILLMVFQLYTFQKLRFNNEKWLRKI